MTSLPGPTEPGPPPVEGSGVRPSGTVTFLFTDIEGSTVLWQEHPEAMQDAVQRHDEILRSVINGRRGYIFSTGGDGVGAAFASAKAAIAAAVDCQLAFTAERWPDPVTVQVRMGLHTGEAQERDGDYFGSTLNRAARIMAAGHGGQILASAVVAHLAGPDSAVTDLGRHRLSGIGPEELFQITAPGPVANFPPLRTEPNRRSNLPTTTDSFVGRQGELDQISAAVAAHRLVTIFGVGGMGKTRLAIEAANRIGGFPDGTWLVELAPARADAEVDDIVASSLGLRPSQGVTIAGQIADWCRRLDALIILDNCEHVLDGVARLTTVILAAGPAATLLTTSREPLIVAGEHVIPLGPLRPPMDAGDDGDAMRLLVDRASAERPDFDPTLHRSALLEICTRLDSMPLAIELASARLRTLTPAALVERLNERFRLLTGGRRTATERHKTLRATVDWSYDLLTPRQQRLFDRLAVFTGPFGLDDVAAVDADHRSGDDRSGDVDVVDVLGDLVDRSLVVVGDNDPPYRMLETLRSYGMERLHAAGIVDDLRGLHARWFCTKGATARAESCGPADHGVFRTLMAQMGDYRAAISWAVDQHDFGLAVDVAATLRETLWLRSEILGTWAFPIVSQTSDVSRTTRARVLWLSGTYMQFQSGDLEAAGHAIDDSVRLDPSNPFSRAQSVVQALLTGRRDHVLDHANAALELAGDDPTARAAGYLVVVHAHLLLGQRGQAREAATEFRDWASHLAWPTAVGQALIALGLSDVSEFPDRAVATFDEALRIAQQIDAYGIAVHARRGMILPMIDRRPAAALAALLDLLRHCRDHDDVGNSFNSLDCAVTLLMRHGDPVTAARLAGSLVAPLVGTTNHRFEQAVTELRDRLGDRYDEIAAEGATLSRWDLVNITIAALADCVQPSP